MTLTIDFPQEIEEWLEQEATRQGQAPAEFVQTAIARMRPVVPSNEEIGEDTARIDAGWSALTALIDDCQMDSGITDLAHQHDHYLYGTPKRED